MKQIPVTATVRDPGGYGEGQGGSGGPGVNEAAVPPNYPPYAYYNLSGPSSLAPSSRDISSHPRAATFQGPMTVTAIRTVVQPGDTYPVYGAENFYPPRPDPYDLRQEYLPSFLELPDQYVRLERYFDVEWKGPEQYKESLSSHCSEILGEYDRIVGTLARQRSDHAIPAGDAGRKHFPENPGFASGQNRSSARHIPQSGCRRKKESRKSIGRMKDGRGGRI
jgi:hypothetical protein